MTKIIINADDYGFCDEVDAGVLEAARTGLISSVAAFANGPDWKARLLRLKEVQDNYARNGSKVKGIDIGCHLTITSGKAVSKEARESRLITNRNGRFYSYTQLKRPKLDIEKEKLKHVVKKEIEAQIARFKKVGIKVAHLSSHHDALTFFEDYFEEVMKIAHRDKIRVRSPKMLPEFKEWAYYRQIGLRLSDNMNHANKVKYREFRKERADWFIKKLAYYSQIPGCPDILDGSNYVTRSLATKTTSDLYQKMVSEAKFEKFKIALADQDSDHVTEYCVHLCSPRALVSKSNLKFRQKRSGFKKNIHFYFGVQWKYFDGRQIEYKTLELLKPKLVASDLIEVIRWSEIK